MHNYNIINCNIVIYINSRINNFDKPPLKSMKNSQILQFQELSVVCPQECLQFSDVGQGDSFPLYPMATSCAIFESAWTPERSNYFSPLSVHLSSRTFDVLRVCLPPYIIAGGNPTRRTKAEIRRAALSHFLLCNTKGRSTNWITVHRLCALLRMQRYNLLHDT